MPNGLQVFDASGDITLDVTDRMTRLYQVGTYQAPAGSPAFPIIFVPITGMSPDGSWFVSSSGPNPCSISNGGFNVQCTDVQGGIRPVNGYSVYRV